MLSIRFDVGGLGAARKTPQGFLVAPGKVTRVGVLEYHRADGSSFRELRHPDEVFHADSVASLAFAPVTDRHPSGLVSPANVRDLQVGIVTNARGDGRFLRSDLIVQDARMIARVERGDAVELSAGYTCRVDETPGVHNGERYDGIQRGIVYNHVAIGPRDWGRAGPEVALHVDGMADDYRAALAVERFDDRLADILAADPAAVLPLTIDAGDEPGKGTPVTMSKIRIDGIEYDVAEAAAPHIARRLDALETDRAAAVERAEKADGALAGVTAELAETKAKLDAATDPAAITAAVAARVALEASARKILGPDVKLDGKSSRDVKVAVLVARDEKFDATGRSDAYIDGRYDVIVESAPERRDERDKVRETIAAPKPTAERIDSADAARRASERVAMERGRQPLPSTIKYAPS